MTGPETAAGRALDPVSGRNGYSYGYEVGAREARAKALADAGYVVVKERLDDALAAIRSLVGDHDIHLAHMPDCPTCIALNGRVAPRLRAALATKETP